MQSKNVPDVNTLINGLTVDQSKELLQALLEKELSQIIPILQSFKLKQSDFEKKSQTIFNILLNLFNEKLSKGGPNINAIKELLNKLSNPPKDSQKITAAKEVSVHKPAEVSVQQPVQEMMEVVRPDYPKEWLTFETTSGLSKKKDILKAIDQIKKLQTTEKQPLFWFYKIVYSDLLDNNEQELFRKNLVLIGKWLLYEASINKIKDASEQLNQFMLKCEQENIQPLDCIKIYIDKFQHDQADLTLLTWDFSQQFQFELKLIDFCRSLNVEQKSVLANEYIQKVCKEQMSLKSFVHTLYTCKKLGLDKTLKQEFGNIFKDIRQVDYTDVSMNNTTKEDTRQAKKKKVTAASFTLKKRKEKPEGDPNPPKKTKVAANGNSHPKEIETNHVATMGKSFSNLFQNASTTPPPIPQTTSATSQTSVDLDATLDGLYSFVEHETANRSVEKPTTSAMEKETDKRSFLNSSNDDIEETVAVLSSFKQSNPVDSMIARESVMQQIRQSQNNINQYKKDLEDLRMQRGFK